MGTDSKSQVSSLDSPQSAMKKSKKKRKREIDNSGDAAVQVSTGLTAGENRSTELQPVNVKIEIVRDQVDKTPPIVGYFPSGYNPCKGKELDQGPKASVPSQPTVRLYRNAQRLKVEKTSDGRNEKLKGSERLELVVSPNDSNSTVEFVGSSYKGEAVAAQLCTYALGILDKETQTLKVVPIAGNKIFRLETRVQRSATSDKKPSGLEHSELSEKQKVDKMRDSASRYETKKSKRQSEKLRALKQGDNPEAQKDLGKQIGDAIVNQDALESTSAHVARNIPPHDISAETPREAYPLNTIILTEDWGFLEDFDEILRRGEVDLSNGYPSFVCNRIHKLRKIQDESEKKKLSSIFSYITHLVKFNDQHSLDGDPAAKKHRFPAIIRQRFFDMFSPERRRLSTEKSNLLISYVLVLTLHADDFQTDPADIAKDLRINTISLRKHFENLGCKLERKQRGSTSSVFTLPTPLKFPEPMQKRKRRG